MNYFRKCYGINQCQGAFFFVKSYCKLFDQNLESQTIKDMIEAEKIGHEEISAKKYSDFLIFRSQLSSQMCHNKCGRIF